MNEKIREILEGDELLEIGRNAIENELVEWRDNRMSEFTRGNGLVIREIDGTASSTIRFGPEAALRIGLNAILSHMESQELAAVIPATPAPDPRTAIYGGYDDQLRTLGRLPENELSKVIPATPAPKTLRAKQHRDFWGGNTAIDEPEGLALLSEDKLLQLAEEQDYMLQEGLEFFLEAQAREQKRVTPYSQAELDAKVKAEIDWVLAQVKAIDTAGDSRTLDRMFNTFRAALEARLAGKE